MERRGPVRLAVLVVAIAVLPARAWAQAPAAKAKAKEVYERLVGAYLNSDWKELREAQRDVSRLGSSLTSKQRADIAYVRKMAPTYRPAWWKACKSTTKKRFRAKIWNRAFIANYEPAQQPSMNAEYNSFLRRLTIIVRWNPSLVDNPAPQAGKLAKEHGLTKGDIGEVYVWQYLGYSYITVSLPINTVLDLYQKHKHLYTHVQEFYAYLTSMYHCSPRARRAAMLMHLTTLQGQAGSEASRRACRAISSLFLAEVLADPKKWPSVKLPWSIPEENVERSTALFVYANISPDWTLDEDRALLETIRKFVRSNGEQVLRAKGRVQLPNKLVVMLIEPDDREFQAKRDAWVKKQLEKVLGQ